MAPQCLLLSVSVDCAARRISTGDIHRPVAPRVPRDFSQSQIEVYLPLILARAAQATCTGTLFLHSITADCGLTKSLQAVDGCF